MAFILKEIEYPLYIETLVAYLVKNKPYVCWLDGNMLIDGYSRFSFLAFDPSFIFRLKGNLLYLNSKSYRTKDPFKDLKNVIDDFLLDEVSVEDKKYDYIPFLAGFVGYISYETVRFLEDIKTSALDYDEIFLAFFNKVIILDNIKKKAFVSFFRKKKSSIAKELKELNTFITSSKVRLFKNLHEKLLSSNIKLANFKKYFNYALDYASYIKKIKKIKEHILAGDIYQACFTYNVSTKTSTDPFSIYVALRNINPAPFSSFLKLGNFYILSSSLERFLSLNSKKVLESRPIKGTCRRGKSFEEDRLLAKKLFLNEKERAENVMIVDLLRNDFSRVCKRVWVPKLFCVETYPTLHQLVSVIRGKLKEGILDALKATFPGGSMTGAPKIKAMEILSSLENTQRGVYAGCLGYFDVRGGFDLSMVIRTIVCKDSKVEFNVGGGIVFDSKPELEFAETLLKASALEKAIIFASNFC